MTVSRRSKHASDEGSLDQYLKDISRYPLITREREAELARAIRTGDRESLLAIIA